MPLSESLILSSPYPRQSVVPGTFVDQIFANSDSLSTRTAVLDAASGRKLSFADLKRVTGQVASALAKRGFGRGDILTMFGSNCLENASILFGAAVTGGTVQLVRSRASKEELHFHLSLVSPKIIVTTSDCAPAVLEAVRATKLDVQDIFSIGDDVVGCRRAEELLEDPGDANPWGKVDIDPHTDVALMMQTGGTTGMSKTVMQTHQSWKESFRESIDIEIREGIENLSLGSLPFHHTYSMGLLYGKWFTLGCGVLNIDTHDPETLLRAIEKYQVSGMGFIPTTLTAIEACPYFAKADLSSLRRVVISGSAMSKALEERLVSAFLKRAPNAIIDQGYGMTECEGPVSTFPEPSDPKYKKKFGSVGLLRPGFELRIVSCDKQKRPCKAGEPGHILLRSSRVMKGYFKNEKATRETIIDGWYYTGDFGYFDEDEYLYVTERVGDLIHHKDGLILPTYVEGVLRSHPSIKDCAVVGKSGCDEGDVAIAFVVRREGCDVTEEEVQRFAEEHLAPHEQLTGGVRLVASIPKSPTGKVLRRMLTDEKK